MALGFFDGVHLAHRALISRARQEALCRGVPLCVFTFRAEDSGLKAGVPRIYSTEQKLRVFTELGVDVCVIGTFSDVCACSPDDFVRRTLLSDLHAVCTVCGFNFRYGAGAQADADDLAARVRAAGAAPVSLPPFLWDGEPLSSTLVRAALCAGEVSRAARMLGAPYFLCGEVAHGDGRGHTLGIPTLNLPQESYALLPAGVYATRTLIRGGVYPSVSNVGTCPTFGARPRHTETYLMEFNGTLYGEDAVVEFLKYLRPEQAFSSAQELKKQIEVDKTSAMKEFDVWQASGQN